MRQFLIIMIFFVSMIFKYKIVQHEQLCNKTMASTVCLTPHKLMKKLSIDMVQMSFCRAQKTAVNHTISSHTRFAKEKVTRSFGRSKSDILPRLFVLRKSVFAFNNKQNK